MQTERRKAVRYFPRSDLFAALGEGFTKVGKIVDIGTGGLSLEYVAGQEVSYGESVVDIFPDFNQFHLYNLPCRIVYGQNTHVREANRYGTSLLISRKCGIQFLIGEPEREYVEMVIMAHII